MIDLHEQVAEEFEAFAPVFDLQGGHVVDPAIHAEQVSTWHALHPERKRAIDARARLKKGHKPGAPGRPGRAFVDDLGVVYTSLVAAGQALGVDKSGIWRALTGKQMLAAGRSFRYL